jgi:hypothetical protein
MTAGGRSCWRCSSALLSAYISLRAISESRRWTVSNEMGGPVSPDAFEPGMTFAGELPRQCPACFVAHWVPSGWSPLS